MMHLNQVSIMLRRLLQLSHVLSLLIQVRMLVYQLQSLLLLSHFLLLQILKLILSPEVSEFIPL